MRILEEAVERYLHDLRPERSEVMREMEELAERSEQLERGRVIPGPGARSSSSCASS